MGLTVKRSRTTQGSLSISILIHKGVCAARRCPVVEGREEAAALCFRLVITWGLNPSLRTIVVGPVRAQLPSCAPPPHRGCALITIRVEQRFFPPVMLGIAMLEGRPFLLFVC